MRETEYCSNDAENTAAHHRNKLQFKTFFRITDKVLAFDLLSILILDKWYMSL